MHRIAENSLVFINMEDIKLLCEERKSESNVDSSQNHSRLLMAKGMEAKKDAPFTFAYVEKLLRRKNLSLGESR